MMRVLGAVALKELVDNFRDRRAVMSALVFGPLFGPVLFAMLVSFTLDKAISEIDERVELAVSGASHAPNLVQFLEQNEVVITALEVDADGARAAVREGKHGLVMLIPASYAQAFSSAQPAAVQLFSDSSDNRTGKYASRVRKIVAGYGAQIGLTRLLARGVNPEVSRAVVLDDVDVSTPAGRAMLVLGVVTYFVLFSMLMGGLYLAIDATAGERERGSLESLLTLPVQRSTVIWGKILATCCYMLLSLALTLAAFTISVRFVPLASLGMSANFGPVEAGRVFLLVAPFVLLGAGIMTVVASFTRTYKEAQTWLGLVLLVPTLPIIFAGLYSLRPSNALMAVPSLSQHLLMTSVLRDEPLQDIHIAISVGTTLLAGLLLAGLAARLYRREAILG